MKLELCSYSGIKIYPGHGKRFVRADGRKRLKRVAGKQRILGLMFQVINGYEVYHFLSAKCERSQAMKRNPREINWTVLYRRKNKKGQQEEVTKKRSRRTQKYQRAITGATLSDILAKRNQKPEVRKAQREQAIRAAKEKQRQKDAGKKPAKPAPTRQQKKQISKQPHGKQPRVGGKR